MRKHITLFCSSSAPLDVLAFLVPTAYAIALLLLAIRDGDRTAVWVGIGLVAGCFGIMAAACWLSISEKLSHAAELDADLSTAELTQLYRLTQRHPQVADLTTAWLHASGRISRRNLREAEQVAEEVRRRGALAALSAPCETKTLSAHRSARWPWV